MSLVTPAPLVDPAAGGVLDVFRRRYLLRLLVRRELRARYHGSVLGMGWSYVRPAVSFGVYFLVVGLFLRMNQRVENFGVFLFSGMVLINFFNEGLHSTTRSIRGNAPLIRKVYLPREMFPVAAMLVSAVHFVPGLVILIGGALLTGWTPSLAAFPAAMLGFAVVAVLGMALGLLFAASNVFLRDLEQVVDILGVVITWSVPMIYPWTTVRDVVPAWVLEVYLANPLVSAVSLFQYAFWLPGVDGTFDLPPALFVRGAVSLVLALLLLWGAQIVFSWQQRRFAEEL